MSDLTFLLDYIDVVNLGICLCVGFAIKYAKLFEKIGNQYIPLIMLVLGCAIGVLTHLQDVNATVILSGMISGLGSTGLYEMLRNLLHKEKEESTKA